ncbi:MAG TPA: DinB family protein [Dehalococcoidia bacterium]|nr:DinB family protein [Dehalococcoidia bacterium]
MREISREPQTHEFIIKALREAGGELLSELEAIRARDAHRAPPGEWSFAQIAVHVRDNEQAALDTVQCIVARRNTRLPAPDVSATAMDAPAASIDLDRCAYQYAQLRHLVLRELWSLMDAEWDRAGVHPYRGSLSVLQIARELHLHDLEHLWQVRSHREQLAVASGG